jgi:amidase
MMTRACLVVGVLLMSLAGSVQPGVPAAFELDEMTVQQLQHAMRGGQYTSRRLVDLYLERIERLDRSGPALRSVIETNPDARAIADALDAERKVKGPPVRCMGFRS